jgi:hypothetical protein
MTSQNAAGSAVIPYAPQAKNTDRQGDQLDRVGHGQSPSKAVGDPSPGGFAICGCDRRISGTAAALSAIRHGGLRSISRAAVNIDRTLDPNQMPAKGGTNEDSTQHNGACDFPRPSSKTRYGGLVCQLAFPFDGALAVSIIVLIAATAVRFRCA